jgi:hypothetical protein
MRIKGHDLGEDYIDLIFCRFDTNRFAVVANG